MWRIEYVRYRCAEYRSTAYAQTEDEAQAMAQALSNLKHVSDVEVIEQHPSKSSEQPK